MIAIIDYGRGNLFSVEKAFEFLGAEAKITNDITEINNADKVVLPGVGAFGDCMETLTKSGLVPVLKKAAAEKPFLGICLGLQLMFEGSEESPGVAGLGIFSGMIKKIQAKDLKIPHMGWNNIFAEESATLFKKLPQRPYVYFVHSYHAVPVDKNIITAWTEYGEKVTAAVGKGNVQATQFHPEKSGDIGLQILRNFIDS
ncbi:imidazole glycerol phosphate synthase subunit HisH [Pectinatus brassicae]|uniref:Imidazole glycerol phosphate synthase subunit HisH n=1 Tax=Pectinatus brassicae TaxID=862415 RepID=A0A840UNQ0_9FIRM|nr:imidazole glycerol phosphate synthase subunit HisH [Pectinatus brassicae]MBB5336328.1 glutamine amidotransferase [Pectinatus brassicae]